MTLTKGFLNKRTDLKEANLVGGLILWTLTSYIFYALFQLYREIFRFFSGHLGDQVLLVLTPTENYLYNTFFAALASTLGFFSAIRFVLQSSANKHDWRTKSLIRRTLNSEGFNNWSFLFWFGKLGSLLGIWYLMSALQYDLDLIKEFPLILLLLPSVLFYSTWPNLSRLIRTQKALWFLKISGVFLIMSFGLAFKNFTDYKAINSKTLKHSISHTFGLNVPLSQSHERIERQWKAINVYIVPDTLETDEPAIFLKNIETKVNLHNIEKALIKERERYSYYEQYQITINLHVDSRVSMKYITLILDVLRKSNLREIQFSTGRKYSRYPSDYPAFRYSGIKKNLPSFDPEFEDFLDSVEQIDLIGKRFKLSESLMYRNGMLKNFNRIEINVHHDFLTLNNQRIDSLDLEQKVYDFIRRYAPNYVIIMNSDEDITYQKYIEVLDILWTQVDRLRNEMCLELYEFPFDDYRDLEHDMDTIKRQFPRHILEWSTEERRMNELIKKADNRR